MPRPQRPLPEPIDERTRAPWGPRDLKTPGTSEWCWQTVDLLQRRLERLSHNAQDCAETLAEVAESRAWEKVPAEAPYGDRDKLAQAEFGHPWAVLEQLVRLEVERQL